MFGSYTDEQLEKFRALFDRSTHNDPHVLNQALCWIIQFAVQDEIERRRKTAEREKSG